MTSSTVPSKDCPQDPAEVMRLLAEGTPTSTLPDLIQTMMTGRVDWSLVYPIPDQDPEDRAAGDVSVARARAFATENFDPTRIDAEARMPPDYATLLRESGLLRMAMPKAEGGLGLSLANRLRVIEMLASWTTPLAMSVSLQMANIAFVDQVADPHARRRLLGRIADGAILSLGATEDHGASNLIYCTTAEKSDCGRFYVVNGEKVYIGNAPIADFVTVLLTTTDAQGKPQISGFIVDTTSPGFEVVEPMRYMGIRGLSNARLRFTNVKVPVQNMIGALGGALKITLEVMPTAKLFIPAMCIASAKLALSWSLGFSRRLYMNVPLSGWQMTQGTLSSFAAGIYAMEAMTAWAVDAIGGGARGVSPELDLLKVFTSETAWSVADRCMALHAGRGYETAASLADRGATAYPVERLLRDIRVHRIFGTTNELLCNSAGYQAVVRASAALTSTSGNSETNGSNECSTPPEELSEPNQAHFAFVVRSVAELYAQLVKTITSAAEQLHGGPGPFPPAIIGKVIAAMGTRQTLNLNIGMLYVQLFAMLTTLARAATRADGTRKSKAARNARSKPSSAGAAQTGVDDQTLADLFCREAATSVRGLFQAIAEDHEALSIKVSEALVAGKLDAVFNGVVTNVPAA